jgi:hypothetical protein
LIRRRSRIRFHLGAVAIVTIVAPALSIVGAALSCGARTGLATPTEAADTDSAAANIDSAAASVDSGAEAKDTPTETGPADAAVDADASAGGEGGYCAQGPKLCPLCPPKDGSPCINPRSCNLVCEYGDDPRPYQNTIATCTSFQWVVTPPPADPAPPPLPAACPATLRAAQSSSTCDANAPPSGLLTCFYPGGSCICYPGGDAGPFFSCVAASADCPPVRPRIGTPCTGTDAGQLCRYNQDYCVAPTATLFCGCNDVWTSIPPLLCPR